MCKRKYSDSNKRWINFVFIRNISVVNYRCINTVISVRNRVNKYSITYLVYIVMQFRSTMMWFRFRRTTCLLSFAYLNLRHRNRFGLFWQSASSGLKRTQFHLIKRLLKLLTIAINKLLFWRLAKVVCLY